MNKVKKPMIIETADIYLHFPYIMKEEADDLADFLEEEHIEYEGAIDIFMDLQNQIKKQKEVIDKAINLNEKIKHFVYENLLEENIIGSKIIYEFVEKQNKILKEVSE